MAAVGVPLRLFLFHVVSSCGSGSLFGRHLQYVHVVILLAIVIAAAYGGRCYIGNDVFDLNCLFGGVNTNEAIM